MRYFLVTRPGRESIDVGSLRLLNQVTIDLAFELQVQVLNRISGNFRASGGNFLTIRAVYPLHISRVMFRIISTGDQQCCKNQGLARMAGVALIFTRHKASTIR